MEPNLIIEPKLITLAQLVMTHSPAVLSKAVEKHGLYGWDEFGVWGEFKKNTETVELHPNLTRDLHRILTHPI